VNGLVGASADVCQSYKISACIPLSNLILHLIKTLVVFKLGFLSKTFLQITVAPGNYDCHLNGAEYSSRYTLTCLGLP